ncbi:zinc ribbon domain-containing protein [Haloarchaeobius sp. DYHT-AS-18]|uniref:zinc ribbon domain-containing protein n=1 Tax=Haloarchaeobius sp. DYHT-AS-18 TaxID=3446117 RepID=UPI003EC1210F
MANGIRAVAGYAPRFRITADEFAEAWGRFEAGGIEEKAVAGADEDALTMAAEVARDALHADGTHGEAVSYLAFASSTPPLAEEDLTARLGAMLGVSETAARRSYSGSTRAGTQALLDAIDSDVGDGIGLVVVADCPRGHLDGAVDHAAGAGAAAFVVVDEGLAHVTDRAEYATPYPGTRFRETGSDRIEGLDVTNYDRKAFREVVTGAADQLGQVAPDAAAVQSPDGRLPYRVAGGLGVDTDTIAACATVHDLGDTGAASVPLGIVKALAADDQQTILGVSFGSGAGSDAFVVECESGLPSSLRLDGDQPISYAEYLRQRGEVTSGPPSGGGAYVSVPTWKRSIPQRYRLEAGRCPECGALNFPPEGACNACNTRTDYDPVELAGTGTVEALTTISQGGAPPEFAEQQGKAGDFGVAVVALDGPKDGSVSAPAQVTDAAPDALSVGDTIETVIRRIYTQEGVTRYGFKIRPQG